MRDHRAAVAAGGGVGGVGSGGGEGGEGGEGGGGFHVRLQQYQVRRELHKYSDITARKIN